MAAELVAGRASALGRRRALDISELAGFSPLPRTLAVRLLDVAVAVRLAMFLRPLGF